MIQPSLLTRVTVLRPFATADTNFEWLFTRQTWVESARNFARTRFKRFRTFEFPKPKKLFGQNFGRKIFGRPALIVVEESQQKKNLSRHLRHNGRLRRHQFRNDSRHFIFRRRKNCFETSNSRLPPEDGSVRPQTLGKCVSDDSRHFNFRRQQRFPDKVFRGKLDCHTMIL